MGTRVSVVKVALSGEFPVAVVCELILVVRSFTDEICMPSYVFQFSTN